MKNKEQQLNWQICKSFRYPITKGKVLTKTWLMVDNKVMWWVTFHRFRVHTTICCIFVLKLTKCRHKTCNSFKKKQPNPPPSKKQNKKNYHCKTEDKKASWRTQAGVSGDPWRIPAVLLSTVQSWQSVHVCVAQCKVKKSGVLLYSVCVWWLWEHSDTLLHRPPQQHLRRGTEEP